MNEARQSTIWSQPLPDTPGSGLLEVSRSMVVTSANRRASVLLGRAPDTLRGTHLKALVAPEGVHRLAQAFLLEHDSSLRGSAQAVPFHKADGNRVYLDVEVATQHEGQESQILVELWDVSNYALREKRSESLAANVPGVLFQLYVRKDNSYGFYYLSPRCFDLFGAAPTAIMRDPLAVPLDSRDTAEFEASLHEAFESRSSWSYEGRLLIKGLPTRWWRAEGKLVGATAQEVVLDGLAYDITGQKETQDALARANKAKEKFLSHMSHELRTPLNAIIGSAQMLSRSRFTAQQQGAAVASIIESGDHLLSLVNDVLDLATLESGNLTIARRPFEASDMVARITAIARASKPDSDVEIEWVGSPIEHVLIGDERRISQILLNLLANAVKFTDRGTIELSVELKTSKRRHHLVARVADSGPGISSLESEQLFAPFSQGESGTQRGGTGLGLAISRELAEAMGGTLTLEPTTNCGATFRLDIPIEAGERSVERSRASTRMDGFSHKSALHDGISRLPDSLQVQIGEAAAGGDMGRLLGLLPDLQALNEPDGSLDSLISLIEEFEVERVYQALLGGENG
ncbi:MAG: ATP-binding protein [Spirochaetales bacterium]